MLYESPESIQEVNNYTAIVDMSHGTDNITHYSPAHYRPKANSTAPGDSLHLFIIQTKKRDEGRIEVLVT